MVTRAVCVLVTRAYGAWRVWSHGMTYVPVLCTWTMCAKRKSSWSIAPVCAGMLCVLRGKVPSRLPSVCGYVADEDVGYFRRVYVISGPTKDEFELTSDPRVIGMVCV